MNKDMITLYGEFASLDKNQSTDELYVYKLNEKYGEGTICFYKIIDGGYVGVHNYSNVKDIDPYTAANADFAYSKEGIFVSYALQGNLVCDFNHGFSATMRKGETFFFAGSGSFESMEAVESSIRAVTIFCVRELVLESLSKMFLVDQEKIQHCFISLSNNPFVIKTNKYCAEIVSDIQSRIKRNEVPMIKIRGLELIYDIIENHENYRNFSKGGYKKELINKIIQIKEYIIDNPDKNLTITKLAKKFSISETYLKEVFKYVYGVPVATYANQSKLEHARKLLIETDLSITAIAGEIGYANQSKFSNAFKKSYKMLPSSYRRSI